MIMVLVIAALLGHTAICIATVNRVHGFFVSRLILKVFDAFWYAFALSMLFPLIRVGLTGSWPILETAAQPAAAGWLIVSDRLAAVYLPIALCGAVVAIVHRLAYIVAPGTTTRLTSNHTRRVSLLQRLGHRPVEGWLTGAASRLPGNEILQLHIHDKKLVLPYLRPALHGLTITHLSDLHLTGQLSKPFYREVVAEANALGSDLVVLTGDIVEKTRCLPWIAELLGQLRGRYGVYYVLGNHERRIRDEAAIRAALNGAGMTGLGGRVTTITVRGCEILLAGTEMPWYRPAPAVMAADTDDPQRPLRVLLSHSPDQLPFARRKGFDLMLAGHTHGGQARLPLLGPILSPSIHGIRHAAGTFFVDPTLLHVSRGLAGTRPLRWNCPPEISKLILVADAA